jgi:flagellum-specific peptidoglycan hydrolase FlgJ
MLTPEQQAAVKVIVAAAVASERATACPAELSAAQCIFESGYLSRAPGNNCFGIKSTSVNEPCQLLTTKEWFTDQQLTSFLNGRPGRTAVPTGNVNGARKEYSAQDWFRSYDTLAGCFNDHARIIQNGPYLSAWQQYRLDRILDAYIAGVAAHYATDPTYKDQITSEARSATVTAALAAARAS